jgi:predicted ArsR family transcriptional regulator
MSDTRVTQESRGRVLATIELSDSPLTVEEIAERTSLHPNTVRGHIDVLLASGAVTREAADAAGRGRPRWLYHASAPQASPFQALAEALSTQLSHVDDPKLAERAAEQWARALPALIEAQSPDEAVSETTDALNRLGFSAVTNPVGDAIAVTQCPYAALVDDNPVICDIHTALIARLLKQTGQPVTVGTVDVWARPGICIAHLNRPDLKAARTITANARGRVAPATSGKR